MARPRPENRLQKTLRSDGALCVSFANAGVSGRETLAGYDDLLAWCLATGAVDSSDAARLEGA